MLYYVTEEPVVFALKGRNINHLGGAKMALLRRNLSYLLLALILVLAISACVRPFGQSEAEQAEQATQEAEAQAATQVAEQVQAEEETADASEEAAEPESETEEIVPVEPETGAAEEVAESEEAASPDSEVDEGTPDTEEQAPAVVDEAESEEAPSAEEDAEAADVVEGEPSMGEEPVEEAPPAEEKAEEAAAEGEITAEPEAEEPMQTTLPATHTVAPGENLFRIGLKYGMSWIPLAVYNNIPNANLIYTGQVIRIPGGQAPPTQTAPEGAAYTNYVVKPGDTLFRISRAFGVSPEEIVKANGLMNPNLIYAGQVLKIPTS